MREQLEQASARFAHIALDAHGREDHELFAVNAAASLELLMKASLCKRHPSLIAASNFDSLLHACDLSDYAQMPRGAMRTIGGGATLDRAGQILPGVRAQATALRPLIDSRNGVLHLGDPVHSSGLWLPYLRATGVLLDDLGSLPTDYWADYAELVATALRDGVKDAEVRAAAKISTAQREFGDRYRDLGDEGRRATIRAIEASHVLEKYEEEHVNCPACGSEAVLSGHVDARWEMDDWGDGASFIADFTGSHLLCRVCGLELDGDDELDAAGVEADLVIDDADPGDFYEPDGY